ncbi:MAG: GTPase [Comamonadaceae bacterium]|nr:GTPase [Comamonadaceae bacterium]
MNNDEIRAILIISLLAAYADSEKHAREREEIRRIAEGLVQTPEINLPGLYQDVLLKRITLDDAVQALPSEEGRHLAYEMAVCVCDADDITSAREQAFLDTLREKLGLDQRFAHDAFEQTQALAQAPLQTPEAAPATTPVAAPTANPALANAIVMGAGMTAGAAASAITGALTPAPAPHPQLPPVPAASRRNSTLGTAEMDSKILRAAILNGAIELLPESLSTMAIIPLQMRLVYQIGQSYGYELDKGHIRDFLATIGVGMTSQYLEQAGRKLLKGLLGKAGKGLLGGLGKQAVSSGMSFASTYALGHVANQYYAGGRALSAQMLKDAYRHVLGDGRTLYNQYLPHMQEQARGLDASKILALVRGQG